VVYECVCVCVCMHHPHHVLSLSVCVELFESLKKAKYVSEAGLILDDPRDNTEWENVSTSDCLANL